jgi:orotate phosphoribosyltransferase
MSDRAAHRIDPAPGTLAWLSRCIADSCIFFASETHPIISPSGKSQTWLFDLRRLFVRAEALEALAAAFYERFKSEDTFQLAGMETASIPLLTALALEGRRKGKAVSVAIIRKDRKRYGLSRNIEGDLGQGPVILVDDIVHSGKSAEKARVALAQEGVRIKSMFVVIDHRSRDGLAWRKQHGIEVHALFTPDDFGLKSTRSPAPPLKRRYRPLWRFQVPGASAYHVVPKSAPLLVGDRLYFGTDRGSFWALDGATGNPVWEFQARVEHRKGIWSSAAHHAGRVYFGTYAGNVHCLEAASGREVWCQPACEWVGSSPLILPEHGSLAIGLEYARPRAGGSLCALSLETGEKVWERWLRVVQHGSAAHWHGGDLAIFGTNDHNVIALKAGSGETVWTFDTRRSVKYPPAVDEARGLVAFASFDRSIYILDVATGQKRAEFKTNDICYTTPLFAHGKLFCGSGDRHLYVIDLDTMSVALKFDAHARVHCSPRLIGDSVIFGDSGGVVRELDPVSLDVVGKITVPDAVTNAIAFDDTGARIYVPTYMNEIYAFDRE